MKLLPNFAIAMRVFRAIPFTLTQLSPEVAGITTLVAKRSPAVNQLDPHGS
ncbi:hypothetical protein [Cylindrospermum sp. FACHB-282]|uniref:hypothetical protein n=1 Tax=Cylindrospermum sp. FACHB-282 TaxID=2692794 RepID=UPI001683E8D5|nr:hypothetical protein [Cylindrospermum sp. FACHB-282]MBD2388579.1 hypothetical protein [Cylindrospermum sp. FACHB-282]